MYENYNPYTTPIYRQRISIQRVRGKISHGEEETIKKTRRKISQKLGVPSIKAAIELFKKVTQSCTPTSSFFNNGTTQERVRFS